MKYYLIAGEASGDLHGSNLLKGLVQADPQARFRFWGGEKMRDVWQQSPARKEEDGLVMDYRQTAVMGISDVLKNLGKISRNLSLCKNDILQWRPDVVILIDYPGFNLKIARFAKEHGFKVFYYIAPKVWASREGRIRQLKAYVDRLFLIFPFEIPYFTKKGVPFIYKGNPLIDAIDASPALERTREAFFATHTLPECRYVALLAGSRKGEIGRMMPVCMEAADRLASQDATLHFLVAGAPSRCPEDYQAYIGDRANVHLIFDDTYGILKNAECAVINSGTASLEAALIGTPQVVCWSASKLTYFIGKYVLRVLEHVKYISLGNLILDRLVFKEFIQDDFNPTAVCQEVRRLMEEPYRTQMLEGYAQIREALGGGGASQAVAQAMLDELKKG
ncbi:MAG: lipid-A-disaccharide synthase [Bacteroidales bacterium]|nr:lipid-A-disaccharide synthase [Bacteroidales bacterium]